MSCTREWRSQKELQAQAIAVQRCCAAGQRSGLTMHAVGTRMVPWQHRHCAVRIQQSAFFSKAVYVCS